jgi:hypothetical protein
LKLRIAPIIATALLCLGCDYAERDASGQIVDGGSLDVADLRVSDCFQSLHEDRTLVSEVSAVNCDQPHDNEVYYVISLGGDAWPGEENVNDSALRGCFEAFEPFVGTQYEDSRLEFTWFAPNQRAWEQLGYRDIACILFDANLERLSGSMKNSRQ